ncbi:hypothetical protein C8Q74DRAFT_755798 [Fomes fomentarius]|nr:hypothetical protein C8Q74DRAFT_755798 [Fomes fomentarius]
MDRLPIEVLEHIFQFACSDGGYTGCSLSLTSKAVHAVAQSARFHSVALVMEIERINSFVALYKRQCVLAIDAKPRITHLHLSLLPRVVATIPGKPDSYSDSDSDDMPELVNVSESEDDEDAILLYCEPLRALFQLIADDLHTLVLPPLNGGGDTAWAPLFARPFLSLRELTFLRHGDPCAFVTEDYPTGTPLFPVLTHLHLAATNAYGFTFANWATHAPHLTHLRWSAFPLLGVPLKELPKVLGVPSEDPPTSNNGTLPPQAQTVQTARILRNKAAAEPEERMFPGLRGLVLQPVRALKLPWCGVNASWTIHERLCKKLDRLAEAAARDAGIRVRTLAQTNVTADWEAQVREDWQSRLSGSGVLSGDWLMQGELDAEDGGSRAVEEDNKVDEVAGGSQAIVASET